MCGCIVNGKMPPPLHHSDLEIAAENVEDVAGGVQGRSDWKRYIMKYTASSRIHSTGSLTMPVGSLSSIS